MKNALYVNIVCVISVLLCVEHSAQSESLRFVAGAPTHAPGEPMYNPVFPIDVDWFSQQIAGNYYFAVTAPNAVSGGTFGLFPTTIGVYQFQPGPKPGDGTVNFVAAAPTNTAVEDSFFSFPMSVSWFPSSLAGNYYFTVVGSPDTIIVGSDIIESSIRVYRFIPNNQVPTNGSVEFITYAPVPGEPSFLAPNAVDWFPYKLGSTYYFAVAGFTPAGTTQSPEVRVYSFSPWSNTLAYVGAAACGAPGCTDAPFGGEGAFAVDWLDGLVQGNALFAVGGHNDGVNLDQEVRVYRFLPNQGPGPENRIQLLATAPTPAQADRVIDAALSVRWLTVHDKYYLAVGVLEDAMQPNNIKNRSVRIYQFHPNKADITQSTLTFITSAPTCQTCTLLEQQDAFMHAAISLDWLTKDGNYYLLVGEAEISECGVVPGGKPCPGQGTEYHQRIRLYQFDVRKKKLIFLGGAWPNQDELGSDFCPIFWPSAVDWFPDSIRKGCYLVSGINSVVCGGTCDILPDLVRVYLFRPACNFNALSYRTQEEEELSV